MEQTSQGTPGRAQRARKTEYDRNVLTAARGAGITFVGKIVQQLLSLGFIFLMARMLGAEQYGLYRLAITIVTVLAGISMFGMDGGIKRYIPIARAAGNTSRIAGVVQMGVGIPFVIGIVITLVILLLGDPISAGLFSAPDLAPVLSLAAIAIPIFVLSNSFSSIAMAYKKVEYDVYTQDIGLEAVKLLLSLGAIFLGFGVVGVTISFTVAAALSLLPLVYLVHRLFPLGQALMPVQRNTREIFGFSFPLFFSTLLNQFGRRLETLVLGVFSVVADVGIYSAMLSISNVGTLANVALRGIATPIISELHSSGKIDDLKRFYQTITKWSVTFNLPVFLIALLFSESLLLFLGSEFSVGAFGLIVLSVGNLFDASTGVCGVMISFTGHSRVTLFNSIAYLVASIVLDLVLIPRWGLEGAAWAGALTVILVNSLRLVQVYVLINHSTPFNVTFLKPLAASVVAGGVTLLLKQFVLVDSPLLQCAVLSVLMVGVYVSVIILLKLSDEDRLVVGKIWARGFLRRSGTNVRGRGTGGGVSKQEEM